MAKKPMLTKLEFAKKMSTYANISVPQANACIEFYSYVIEECIKNDLEFQVYNIGKFYPLTIEQEEEKEKYNSFTKTSYFSPEHGDFTRMRFRGGNVFNKRIKEITEKPFDSLRPPKVKKEYFESEDED